jgi:ubiquinone/menaquinone biosynthesis C-methylase UbiE
MIPRRLVASDHREAYDLWAKHFEDPALMANRDADTTRRKLSQMVSQLPLGPHARVLDVGPGDGTFFRLVAKRVRQCCGVDPSANAVSKLASLFQGATNVEFKVGSAEEIPYADHRFDVVVINSVLQILPSKGAVEQALSELVRVCAPGGGVFVGELPFRAELSNGILVHMGRKLREFGVRAFSRTIYSTYIRPVLRGEPLVLYPATNLYVSQAEFESMCRSLGLIVSCRRHQELRRPSETRNDYLLTLPA